MSLTKSLIVICGPTGIGKTGVGIKLAQHFQCDIVSSDSRQIFQEMSIGTAVPSKEELIQVRHHFIQTHSIHEYYNASLYEQEVLTLLKDYFQENNTALLVGGSGLYIASVCKGIDELPTVNPSVRARWQKIYEERGLIYLQETVKKIDPEYFQVADIQNHKRLLKAIEIFDQTGKAYSGFLKNTDKKRPFSILKLGLNTKREILYNQINLRVDKMIEEGLVEEARALYPFRHLTPLKTVGYKELFMHFEGKLSPEEAIEQIKNHSRAYARRQITWFRRDKEIEWFEPDQLTEITQWLNRKIKQK